MANKLNIGLFGFGCVGQGLYHVLNNSRGFTANIAKIGVKNRNKVRTLDKSVFTFDKYEILDNPEINVIVELIDDATEAFEIVKYALQKGKHVVTANKKMVASHLSELQQLQEKHNVSLLYEASTCGSIPIIRTLEEYFDNEQLNSVSGIFNGTTNYVLTKTISEKLSYGAALSQAQEKGFAESDPTNDVEGFDPKFKAVILALHAFGVIVNQEEVFNLGITTLADDDIRYAFEKDLKIKLVPTIRRFDEGKVSVFVLPKLISHSNPLYFVDNEFNGVVLEGDFSGEQFLKGRGAGGNPTGAAVLSDISALSFGYRYEFKKFRQKQKNIFTNRVLIKAYIRFNGLADIEKLGITEVFEEYSSERYKYKVALVSLESLIANKKYILENKLFIAAIGEEIILRNEEELILQEEEKN
jgi:homoserine dehydrogenase